MSIGFEWRRIAGADIAGLTAKELNDLVSGGPEDELYRTGYDGVVVGALLGLGDGASRGAEAFVDMPADWDDDYLVGTIGAYAVREIAAAMLAAEWRTWLTAHFDGLMAGAEEAGYEKAVVGAAPDGPWADHLLRCAGELTRFFGAAAAAEESVVFSMSA
ncbi:hypothetical protein [Actinoplanes sp. NPDC051411]|uniref:hypothetical protein n=1 Tax=Actinoplanes sp. NPDC051411 TaxID=3155522 RepID=UPI00342E29C0